MRYASFWVRLAASVVDGLVSGVLVLVLAAGLAVLLSLAIAAIAVNHLEPQGDLTRESTLLVAAIALIGGSIIVLLTLCVYLLYFLLFTGWRGQTPGKMLLGIRVVDEAGNPPGMRRAFMREVVGKFLASSVLYAGFLWPLWDARRQAWHDKIAGTFVIKGTRNEARGMRPPPVSLVPGASDGDVNA